MRTLRDLEEPRHVAFERRQWKVERFGWLAIALVIAGALLGLLGPGALSTVQARTSAGELAIRYPRFARVRASAQLRIATREAGAHETRLWLDGPWVDGVRVLGITPPPTRSELTDGRWTLVFATSRVVARELAVTLEVEPRSAGSLAGRVGLPSGAELAFRQLVYP